MPFSELSILNVKINPLTKAEVLAQIKNLLLSNEQGRQLVTTNPEFIMAAQKDEEFKNIINHSWLSVADGYGIRLAGQYQQAISNFQFPISKIKKLFNYILHITYYILLGLKIAWWGIARNNKKLTAVPEIITGTDLIPEICHLLSAISVSLSVIPAQAGIQSINKKIFLLGGYGDVPRLAAERLLSPPFQGGASCPEGAEGVVNKKKENVITGPADAGRWNPVKINYSTFEENNIIEKINSFQPAVLFVALNHPRAQKWINENLSKMPSVKLAIGVGGAFDYLSGKIKRAPQNFQGSFEWLFRLILQPRRWKRIYTAAIKFPWTIFKKSFL